MWSALLEAGTLTKKLPRQSQIKSGWLKQMCSQTAVGLAVRQQPHPAPPLNPNSPSNDNVGDRMHMPWALPILFNCKRSPNKWDKPYTGPCHEARSRTSEDRGEQKTSASWSSRTTKAKEKCNIWNEHLVGRHSNQQAAVTCQQKQLRSFSAAFARHSAK